mgnify:CR=1 FL=1
MATTQEQLRSQHIRVLESMKELARENEALKKRQEHEERLEKLAKARTKLPLLANFEDLIDDAFDSYKKLPAIPDAKGRLPGQKRKPIICAGKLNQYVVVHVS